MNFAHSKIPENHPKLGSLTIQTQKYMKFNLKYKKSQKSTELNLPIDFPRAVSLLLSKNQKDQNTVKVFDLFVDVDGRQYNPDSRFNLLI